MVPTPTARATEPIAGYTLLERVGAGGYGEVWKADAPGGLVKAVKLVYGCFDERRAVCELKALNRIKDVRHPFLLSLERIEIVDSQLIIVTELADWSLKERFAECKKGGLPGIPRDELLVYFGDTADALDYMSENYSLQHLDVKPENLLILGGRIKVADFGLVKDVQDVTMSMLGGLTPVYAAPEVSQGHPSLRSDQYSLAIVYQEMLTGTLPFSGKNAAQLAAQHTHSQPQVASLPPAERSVIARALAKDPTERFATCREMVQALIHSEGPTSTTFTTTGIGSVSDERLATSGVPSSEPERPAAPPLRPTQTLPFDEPAISPADNRPATATPAPELEPIGEPAATSLTKPRVQLSPRELRTTILSPIDFDEGAVHVRPTLIVGIGGTAIRTLKRLRARLKDRFGDPGAVPSLAMLLVDTDTKLLTRAIQGNEATKFGSHEMLAMPLRQREKYRSDSTRLLRWLSRRWLYNIPRSLQTEGLRPLGRLALVEHAGELVDRLTKSIRDITATEARETSSRSIGWRVEETPRVVVVASISGGTGGGTAIDVLYAAKNVLREFGYDEQEVCGVLAHSTSHTPDQKDLAIANTIACLTETHHYLQAEDYPGDPERGLSSFSGEAAQLKNVYLVHLGDDLDEGGFDSATDSLAEYLYLDTVTAGHAFFDRCRDTKEHVGGLPDDEVPVRTFGVCQVGCSRSGVASVAAEFLCKTVLERWCGAEAMTENVGTSTVTTTTSVRDSGQVAGEEAVDEPPTITPPATEELHLSIEQLSERVAKIVSGELKQSLNVPFDELLDSCFSQHDPSCASATHGSLAARILESVESTLGPLTSTANFLETPANPLQRATVKEVKKLAVAQGALICDWIIELADKSNVKIEDAHNTTQWVIERLALLESQAESVVHNLQTKIGQMEQGLLDSSAQQRVFKKGLFDFGRSKKRAAELRYQWDTYVQLRLDRLVGHGTHALLQLLQESISVVGRQLGDFKRELSYLGAVFAPSSETWRNMLAEETLSSTMGEFQLAVTEILQDRMGELADRLDQTWQRQFFADQGGLRNVLSNSSNLREKLVDALRAMARATILDGLREIDIAGVLSSINQHARTTENPSQSSNETAFLEAAIPRLLSNTHDSPGGNMRTLLMCPSQSDKTLLRELISKGQEQPPSTLSDQDADMVLCCEAGDVSLARVAANLVSDRPDLLEAAYRLHTRSDVEWTPLPEIGE